MTIINLAIPRRALRAVLLFASKQDVRYYLNGVQVEAHADRLFLVATNGHMLGVTRHTVPSEALASAPCTFILPRDMAEKVATAKQGRPDIVTVTFNPETKGLSLTDGDVTTIGQAVDGKFPEWRRVVPASAPSGQAGQFNTDYMAAFGAAAERLGARHGGATVHILHDGDNAALVRLCGAPEFLGVLMGIRAHVRAKSLGAVGAVGDFVAVPTAAAAEQVAA